MNKPLFTFDDGNASDLWAANVLKTHGLQGVFFLNDKPDLEYQVKGLLDMGMIIGNHTANHPMLSKCTPEQVAHEVLPFNERLKSLGASGDWFSYPFSNRPEGAGLELVKNTFKFIFKGYDHPTPDQDGEMSRVSVFNKPEAVVLDYLAQGIPLQLHGINTGEEWAMPRALFIRLVKSVALK